MDREEEIREDEDEEDDLVRAQRWLEEAYQYQMAGDLDRAIAYYKKSIKAYPTAEAYTFLGWTYSFQGRIDEAIAECLKAIEIDPSFGNPYNDIGVYLMEKGQDTEAIPWLEKAKQAERYEPRHFPYLNLGRIYLRKGLWKKALREFEMAVKLAPDDKTARRALAELRARLN